MRANTREHASAGMATLRRQRSKHFVVCSQNHDQVGNRAMGQRLSSLVSFESLKLAAGITVLSSFVPLLFMGEEYGETAPFLYFTSHGDPQLADAVRRGREAEFAQFQWQGAVPDPQAESTFAASKLNPSLAGRGTSSHAAALLQNVAAVPARSETGRGAGRSR